MNYQARVAENTKAAWTIINEHKAQIYITTTDLGKSTLAAGNIFTKYETAVVHCGQCPVPATALFTTLKKMFPYVDTQPAFLRIVANLVGRGYISVAPKQHRTPKTINYTGTLTVNSDGTITFTCDDPDYCSVLGAVPLLTVYGGPRNAVAFRPIAIKAQRAETI